MNTTTRNNLLQGVTDALTLFPFALSVGTLSGFGTAGGCIAAAVSLLFGAVCRVTFVPTYLLLLPVFTAAYRFGAGAGAVCVLLGGVFAFFLSLLQQKMRDMLHTPAIWPGFLVAAAFSTTALQTTHYFDIGAVGGTVPEILRDYVSLGFHPNWRGILYGTIVMVVLITYPRKFKTFSKKLPAAFASLVVTLPLHLLLVQDAAHSPIRELGKLTLRLPDGAFLQGGFTVSMLPLVLCSALSLALLMTAGLSKSAAQKLSAVSAVGGFLGGVPVQTDGTARNRISFLVSVPLTVLLFFVPGLHRLPLPCLAVILIVTAWQSVDWGQLRRAMQPRMLPFMLCDVLLPVLLGTHYALPVLWILGLTLSPKPGMIETERKR